MWARRGEADNAFMGDFSIGMTPILCFGIAEAPSQCMAAIGLSYRSDKLLMHMCGSKTDKNMTTRVKQTLASLSCRTGTSTIFPIFSRKYALYHLRPIWRWLTRVARLKTPMVRHRDHGVGPPSFPQPVQTGRVDHLVAISALDLTVPSGIDTPPPSDRTCRCAQTYPVVLVEPASKWSHASPSCTSKGARKSPVGYQTSRYGRSGAATSR